ncbi:unnamed protein product [Ectocarpus sp. CCAP 1310/34]|nr:unnamed protein product [Ectocarpus sp. CCAP 1310/34]
MFSSLSGLPGSNLECTTLWLALKRLSAMWTKPGERFHIKRRHLQLDNCVGENKNNIVMAFIGGLVAAGVIGFAEVCFLILGHTHIKIDQVFSRLFVGTLGRSIFTKIQLGELFRESYKELPVHVGILTNLGNLKGLYLADNKLNLRKIRNIATFRAFRVGKVAGEVSVWVKRFMHSDAWLGLTATGGARVDAIPYRLFRFAAPSFDNVLPFNLLPCKLKTADPTVIALIEKRYIATRPRLEAAYALDLPMERLHTSIPPATWPPSTGATADGVGNPPSRVNGVSEPSKRKAPNPVRPTSLAPPSVGDIAFFNAEEAPFVLGEVLSIAADASPVNVNIHWYGPIKNTVRAGAGSATVEDYAVARFSKDFIQTSGAKRRTPDASDEAIKRIIVCCSSLTSTGNIPARIKKVLMETCRPAPSSSSKSEASDSDDDGSEESAEEANSEEDESDDDGYGSE